MGTKREVKIHWFISAKDGTVKGQTACGVVCWQSTQSDYEADTDIGSRISIERMYPFHVTCESCLKKGMPSR